VTQKESRSNPVLLNLMSSDMAGMGRKNIEALAAVQKEFLDTLNKVNRAWFACCNEEAGSESFRGDAGFHQGVHSDCAQRQGELLTVAK